MMVMLIAYKCWMMMVLLVVIDSGIFPLFYYLHTYLVSLCVPRHFTLQYLAPHVIQVYLEKKVFTSQGKPFNS